MPSETSDIEKQRLNALRDRKILDTPAEKAFDDLARLAAFICGTPISLVSLVDENRQWFKSRVGLDARETPRDLAFCAHTILANDLLVVPDATKDERFANNALVTDDPNIRFYAGAPLVTSDGFALGSLCVIDRVPRNLTAEQLEALRILRNQVIRELELRTSTQELSRSFSLLEQSKDNYQRLAESLEEAVQLRTSELRQRNQEILDQAAALRSLTDRLMTAQDEERRRLARELHDSAGQLLAATSITIDTIIRDSYSALPKVSRAAEDCRRLLTQLSAEIRTMSYLLHPPLLDESGLSAALGTYIDGIAARAAFKVILQIPGRLPRFAPDVELSLFRVIQECLTNIHRHAECKVATITVRVQDNKVLAQVEDDGAGIPADRLRAIRSHASGVGMRGMQERIRQLGGEMEIRNADVGTCISFVIPISQS